MNSNLKKLVFFPLIFLLLAAACTSTRRNDDQPPQSIVAPDSLFTPTGNAKIDSLLRLAAVSKPDTNLAKLYLDIGQFFEKKNFEKAKEYYFKLKTLSEHLNWSKGLYLFAPRISNIIVHEGLIDSVLVIQLRTLELAKMEKNEREIARCLINIGNCYNLKNWHETSLKYIQEGLSIEEKIGDKLKLSSTYMLLGAFYINMEIYDKSIEYTEKALSILNEKPDTLVRASALINYSVALIRVKQFDKAKSNLLEAERVLTVNNYKRTLINVYNNLGQLALEKHDWNTTEMYNRKALEIAQEFNVVKSICISKRALAFLALYNGNYDKSEEYAKEVLKMANKYDFPDEKRKIYEVLANISAARHNFREHNDYIEKADSIRQKFLSETIVRATKEMETKYETAKKELEIEQQRNIIASQNMQRSVLIAGIAVCALILALLWYMLALRNRRNRALTERNEALAEMNATKNKFFSIISHDLKDPALSQRTALQKLIKHAQQWDVDALMEFYHDLLKSADEQVELIYNLLGWAQIQTGRMAYTPDTLSIADVLPDISLIRKMAENKGISFTAEIPQNALVTCDRNMLSTVIRNLLTNAIKFTPSGGTVILKASLSPSKGGGFSPPKGELEGAGAFTFSIADNGTGMSHEQIQNLFRIDKAHSRQGTAGEQGSGLGLIVCKEFLEKHNSVLHVESEEGKGCRFWFTV